MKISIVGSGYVGLVTGVCLAKLGHTVTMIDIDEKRMMKLGLTCKPPFYEPGLAELMEENETRLFYATGYQSLADADAAIIAVGTPAGKNVRDEMRYFYSAVHSMVPFLGEHTKVIIKSTVLPGTNAKVCEILPNNVVISNPEFLREGSAIHDTLAPDRIVVGALSFGSFLFMEEMYKGIRCDSFVTIRPESAEMVKHASNAFLAMKIGFINEIAVVCEGAGANVYEVRRGMVADSRIGDKFLEPGVGYGGSCFPKDVTALANYAGSVGVSPILLDAISDRNYEQKELMADRIRSAFQGKLEGVRIAVLGLAFKPNTDDTREAPSTTLLRTLKAAGVVLTTHDPHATCPVPGVQQCDTVEGAIALADAAVIMTEWPEYGDIDWTGMCPDILFDGRGVYRDYYRLPGISTYYGVGQGLRVKDG